ncbi:hypothetical protein GALL_548630 [mine drainage metagenome]|uniref:Uncharacterized protein n=1 Tax=mine drainage metagenome TaxID=410659 RepID=A0A1J5P810_9ZZZZ
MVGEFAVVHHLQQDIIDVGVRLFHFVQQKNAMRVLIDAICQHAALVKADIARRRADQAGHRVFLHEFGHVETQQFQPE